MSNIRNYEVLLTESAMESGSVMCMGLDPVFEYLPPELQPEESDPDRRGAAVEEFFFIIFENMVKRGLRPAAFKPNIGYYHVLDFPREGVFAGSRALAAVLDMLEEFFPGTPVILDAKRGDIDRSSENYMREAFSSWQCDAVTVSPFMGTDSVVPFFRRDKGVYILNRTSNPGGADLQDLETSEGTCCHRTAQLIITWHESYGSAGAVVGAVSMDELEELAGIYAPCGIPLLIPGVGSQGGSASEVMETLERSGYEMPLARINSSSALTHPWKDRGAPENWLEMVMQAFDDLHQETSLK